MQLGCLLLRLLCVSGSSESLVITKRSVMHHQWSSTGIDRNEQHRQKQQHRIDSESRGAGTTNAAAIMSPAKSFFDFPSESVKEDQSHGGHGDSECSPRKPTTQCKVADADKEDLEQPFLWSAASSVVGDNDGDNSNFDKTDALLGGSTATSSLSASETAVPSPLADPVVLSHRSPILDYLGLKGASSCASSASPTEPPVRTALIILNTPISKPPSPLFQALWEMSSFRVCADGGANRLYEATVDGRGDDDDNRFVPHLIRGDLDSLEDHVRDYYRNKTVPASDQSDDETPASAKTRIERDPDQESNDLDKALVAVLRESDRARRLQEEGSSSQNDRAIQRCIIYGAFGGRFDQEMASIQALYKWSHAFNHHDLWLYDDYTCACLLQPTSTTGDTSDEPLPARHEIRVTHYHKDMIDDRDRKNMIGEGPTCGLVPMSGPCQDVTTTGLKWNLSHDTMRFGGLVSTSNRIADDTVTVRCSHPLIFTAEMHSGR